MWKKLTAFLLAALPLSQVWAQSETSTDNQIIALFAPIAKAISDFVFYSLNIFGYEVPWILFWLVAASLAFTLYFRFINIRGFAQGFRIIRGDYAEPAMAGETTHFQALTTALSGTVGLGNIAGVALAIAIGGPGAAFWMVVAGILGMSAKFVECTLGVKYRQINADGSISGGPMYYLRDGIKEQYPRLAPLGRIMAIMFAIFCIGGAIGAGNMFQSNAAYQQMVEITGGTESWLNGYAWVFGLGMAILVGIVIVGGIKSIARVTERLVPGMAILYLLAGFTVIGFNIDRLPSAVMEIVSGAFTAPGMAGGALGVLLVGFRRAAFSNEAGIGSAAIAHSVVRTHEPVTEGLVALWEPFVDTVVICSTTALVIVVTQATLLAPNATGVVLTSTAFASVFSWFPEVLAVAVFLFAFSTMIAYSYYGLKAATYLFGESKKVEHGFKILFLSATVVACPMPFEKIVDFSDAIFFLMAVPNVIGLYLLAPVVKRELASYLARLKSGEIAPIK